MHTIIIICADSDQEVSLTINEVAVICTTVTFILAILSGCVCGALLMYWLMRKKAVYSPAAEGLEPTASVDPVYEEVSPKQEIELNTNQAYAWTSRTIIVPDGVYMCHCEVCITIPVYNYKLMHAPLIIECKFKN